MSRRRPPWLFLHEALDRVSQHLFQQPAEGLPQAKSLKVRYLLRDLLKTGDIESYVFIKNKAVRLTTPVMLKPPFGIHYNDSIPGIEVSRWTGQLLSMRLKASDLSASIDSLLPPNTDKRRPKSHHVKNEEALRWLVTVMQGGNRLTKTHCRDEAISRFDISHKAFQVIWQQAQTEANVDWSIPGRFKTI
jgi:hypothetical protein